MSAPLRVVWVSFAPLEKADGGQSSSIASVRYRITLPAAALKKLGCDSRVTQLRPGANRRTLLERFEGADAVVLGKLLAPRDAFAREAQQALELAAALRSRGIKLLTDYTDDHFSDPVRGEGYRAMANAVDRVIASTPQLAQVVQQHSATPVSVITDPVEGARGEPRVASQAPYRLLWFGHPTNLDTLRIGLPQLARVAPDLPHTLTLMSAPGAGAEELQPATFRPWSAPALWEELRRCDAVVIPSNPHDPRKSVKSPNRFTESVWAGRFVIAHPLPAYDELAEYGWVGDDLGEGLRWYAGQGAQARERIERGQAAVTQRFAPALVAGMWRQVILQTLERQ